MRAVDGHLGHRRDRRDARRIGYAGAIADSIVTPSPMTSARTTTARVRGGSPDWTVKNWPTTAFSPVASKSPRASPSSDATRPMASASMRVAPSTCRRLAPMARSNAVSRLRWATMIENVL